MGVVARIGSGSRKQAEAKTQQASAPANPEQERFEGYVSRFRRPIFSYVMRLVRDEHLAEDITQESFVRLYRELEGIRDETASAWLYRVARNLVTDYSRKKKPVLFTVLQGKRSGDDGDEMTQPEFAGKEGDPSLDSADGELKEMVRVALDRMSNKLREPLILCDLENLTYEQAAGVLGCSVKTVSSRLYRAREFLAGCLERYCLTDDE